MEQLAIFGGTPVRKTPIGYGKQFIDDDDVAAVVETLKYKDLTCGPEIDVMERKLCEVTGAKYAVAVSNGTAALHLAALAAGFGEGDEVIVSSITFAASANCILYCGAKPVFADIHPETYNMDPDAIEKLITPRTRGIVAVDFTGQSIEHNAISAICKKHKLLLIEDAAHAIGTKYQGRPVGSIADMTCFSFHPVKHMTTCEGGMVTTNNEELYKKIKAFRAYCITKDPELLVDKEDGPWHYEMQGLGYNYRISDVMCALGMNQLKKVDSFVRRRREIAKRYNEEMKDFNHIVLPYQAEGCNSSWHLYTILVKEGMRRKAYHKLKEAGIGVDVHYLPVYRHPYYQKHGYKDVVCQNAEKVYDQIISIPIFYRLKEEEQTYVIEKIADLVM